MPISEFLDNPLDTMFEPFTNLFETLIHPNAGGVFWLLPLIILTLTIQLKVKDSTVTSMFMIASGALLSGGGIFLGASTMAGVFIIFSAIGFVSLFMSIYFQR